VNHLIIWREISLFIGRNQRAISRHQHPFIQLIIGVDGPYLWRNEHGKWIERSVLLVSPNHAHECNANGQKVAIISIDTESILGEYIRLKYLHSDSIIEFVISHEQFDSAQLTGFLMDNNWEEIYRMILLLFDFDSKTSISLEKDERIQHVVDYINKNIDSEINTNTLMGVSHLSESRLLHLFKQQMGLPIRNYILWCRIQIAFKAIIEGMSLTDAAYYAGFSDQSHLSRTFTKTIGLPPSAVMKNSKFVQVFFPT
jgi:AraC-like DNA-binding protein